MGGTSRVAFAYCLGVAVIVLAACVSADDAKLPLEVSGAVTHVIPGDTARAGDADADTLIVSGSEHACPPGDALPSQGGGEFDRETPPLPPCSDDPVIQ
jgi:hypothetical protein